jgi:hypothetical protein
MAIIQIDSFNTNNGGTYVIYFDTATEHLSREFIGTEEPAGVTEEERGHPYDGLIGSICNGTTKYTFYATFTRSSAFTKFDKEIDSPDCQYTPPSDSCDLFINSVSVTNESSTGANDGRIQVNASSSHGPIQYSLDNSTWQNSNVFNNRAPGNYIVYVRDALSCRAQQTVTIVAYVNPVQNFDSNLPVVELPGGNVSRWNAAFNPIVINYQRKDNSITSIAQLNDAQIQVTLSGLLGDFQSGEAINRAVFIKSAKYSYYGKADSYSSSGGNGMLTITTPYLGDDNSGYIIIPTTKPNYRIQTEITTGSDPVVKDILVAEHTPNKFGATRADISGYLRSLLSAKDDYDYLLTNYKDVNLGGSYTIRFREVWDGGNTPWFAGPYPLYYTYAGIQLGEQYGGNMAKYVPFLTTPTPLYRAKWLTDFEVPTIWLGLPFEISFIYSEYLIGKQLYLEVIPDNGTATEGLLINPDGGYIISEDTSRLKIERVYNSEIEGYPIYEALGINRVRIPQANLQTANYADINIYYLNGSDRVYVMQPQRINVRISCSDPYVYLKWINSRGAWDYWRFGYEQVANRSVSGSQQISRNVLDWENNDTIEDIISRSANRKVNVVSGQIDIKGKEALSWLNNSIKVQMLTRNANPYQWKTVIIPDGDSSPYNTRKRLMDVRVSLILPATNIQQQ